MQNFTIVNYKPLEDGTIGEIEKNNVIRNRGDLIVGINHIHARGMSFEKVVDVIRGIVREEDDVTIEFTFLELKQFLERSKSRSTTGYQASTTATAPPENPQEISTEKIKVLMKRIKKPV